MARKRSEPKVVGPDWFLVDWMRSKRMSQAELARRTGWSVATTNDIYHGKTNYYREILNEAAQALEVFPWELLMSPAEANHIKALRTAAVAIAADLKPEWGHFPLEERKRTGTD